MENGLKNLRYTTAHGAESTYREGAHGHNMVMEILCLVDRIVADSHGRMDIFDAYRMVCDMIPPYEYPDAHSSAMSHLIDKYAAKE